MHPDADQYNEGEPFITNHILDYAVTNNHIILSKSANFIFRIIPVFFNELERRKKDAGITQPIR